MLVRDTCLEVRWELALIISKWIVFLLVLSHIVIVAAEAPPTVLFLGDSLTAGYTLPIHNAYPALVQDRMGSENIRVINAGVSGDTSFTLLNRLPMALATSPNMVFLCIGANDGLRGTPTASIYSTINQIIVSIKRQGIPVALAGMSLPSNYTESYINDFEAIFPRLADNHKLSYMPFLLNNVAGVPTLNLSDRIHPNQDGHRIIAKQVTEFLERTPLFLNATKQIHAKEAPAAVNAPKK